MQLLCLALEKSEMKARDHYLYTTWKSIRQRCFSPSCKVYEHYGGRGITLHEEWSKSKPGRSRSEGFEAFARYVDAVLGPRPEGCSLDRIDNNGHYEPGNLRWATHSEQMENRRHFSCYEIKSKQNKLPWQTKHYKGYKSQFKLDNKLYSAGTFSTPEEASEASRLMRLKLLR